MNQQTVSTAFLRLVQIMEELRAQCPWDKKQTIETLRPLTIEETYELADAIDNNSWQHIKEELGDLLLHIVFYAKIGSEKNSFDITDVMNSLCDKLIYRHPHIYGDHLRNIDELHQPNEPMVSFINQDLRSGSFDRPGIVQHQISNTPGRERVHRYSLDSLAVNRKSFILFYFFFLNINQIHKIT